jgi:hypothetical protein
MGVPHWENPRPDERLVKACEVLAELIPTVPRLGDLFDLSAGVLASLIKANELEYQDRDEELPPEYYPKLSERVRKMREGTLPPRGLWISGYYFNSALMRLAAVRDQLRRVLREINNQRPGSVAELPTDELHLEGDRLKHQIPGLRTRKIRFEEVIQAFEETLAIVKKETDMLNDPRITIPEMRVEPRFRRSKQ